MRFTFREIIGYGFFFLAVGAAFFGFAYYSYLHPRGYSIGLIGYWGDFDEGISQVMVTKTVVSFYETHENPKLYQAKGHWLNKIFYAPARDGSGSEVIVARITPEDDLQLNMGYFDSNDTRQLTCTLEIRGPEMSHPYPVRSSTGNDNVAYPPPKGMIKPGMLETDLQNLPWQPYAQVTPPEVEMQLAQNGSYNGSTFANYWPKIWKYKSDNPSLPELQVRVEGGRVTQVEGGAEDTTGPSYIPNSGDSIVTDTTNTDDSSQSRPRTWIGWIFDLFFTK